MDGVMMSERPRRRQKAPRKGNQRNNVKQKAQELTRSGMPFQMAMAVAQGRMELNEALERLARRAEVDRLVRKHGLSRSLATQVAMGHADLDAYLAKQRMENHLQEHLQHSCLDTSMRDEQAYVFGLHGGRRADAVVKNNDAYTVTLTGKDGEEEVHKLQFKYGYVPDAWKKVRKSMKKDKALASEPREPIVRPQDRYSCSDKRLFRYMDDGAMIDVTLLEGEIFRGSVAWFGRFEFALELKGGVQVVIFRHALHRIAAV